MNSSFYSQRRPVCKRREDRRERARERREGERERGDEKRGSFSRKLRVGRGLLTSPLLTSDADGGSLGVRVCVCVSVWRTRQKQGGRKKTESFRESFRERERERDSCRGGIIRFACLLFFCFPVASWVASGVGYRVFCVCGCACVFCSFFRALRLVSSTTLGRASLLRQRDRQREGGSEREKGERRGSGNLRT